MSQGYNFPNNQGGGSNQGNYYGPPQGSTCPPRPGSSGSSTLKIVLIVVAIFGVLGLVLCGLLAALLIPAIGAARDAAQRMQDQNNLKQIGLAFLNYEAAYKKLPAPKVLNSNETPCYSWSIPLLPFVEESQIFNQINFMDMQPWDYPSNSGIFDRAAPRVLQSNQSKLPPGSNEGNMFVIAAAQANPQGKNPMFIEGEWGNLRDVSDGLSNTIMAIQLRNHSEPWASPVTLTIDEAYQLIQNEDKFFQVVMGDASVLTLPVDIDKVTFEAMVTRDGGEVVSIPMYLP